MSLFIIQAEHPKTGAIETRTFAAYSTKKAFKEADKFFLKYWKILPYLKARKVPKISN